MSSSTSPGVVERVQNFVSENRRAVIIGTAAALVAIGGVAYYASTSRGPKGGDVEKGERKKDKKKKKRKGTKGGEGPILEERTASLPDDPEFKWTLDDIAGMSAEERTKSAASLKTRGNSAYGQRKFDTAVHYYTRAIEVTPKPEPVFYSNRAACYVNMSPPQYEKVVADCDEALKLDKAYVKALNRRATAFEGLGKLTEALRDYTAVAILEKFSNDSASATVERVVKKLATQEAHDIISTRERRLPSYTFISAYFGAFRPRPLPTLPENPSQGDKTLIMSLEALGAGDYAHSLSLINEALEQGISWDAGKAEALNLRGTFKFLMADVDGAKEDFLASIKLQPSLTQTWVKIASVYMEQGDPKKAFEAFDQAIKHNPNDPDIYYHRGQVLFIMNEFDEAAENYTKSTELDNQFVFSQIQLAVAQYKAGQTPAAIVTFRKTLEAFPQRSEPANYYGELLLDQHRYPDSVQEFDRAIEIEQSRPRPPPINVLPYVNKGLALFQWKQDHGAAERCCQEALRLDPECEAAVATLAQLSLQQGKIDVAMEMFERQVALARSEPELANAISYKVATVAQMQFMKNYPELAQDLTQLANTMR
ncbi:ADP/ATP carrier receptor [Laetiporus sulphureus 93-53]|uniref:ADP/ATP carrier receptor n=1 Tax=Laetiporus sulphureus 93-53 TaxID=1314785 RepID=A0A165D2I7_9APHY|nr:ADP/ATP carrier receptor [Laetiporus sulphureus 93-53]KZT04026.1 ADP/ATP carrier receptor [Laetiporus sulphureus 93-53]